MNNKTSYHLKWDNCSEKLTQSLKNAIEQNVETVESEILLDEIDEKVPFEELKYLKDRIKVITPKVSISNTSDIKKEGSLIIVDSDNIDLILYKRIPNSEVIIVDESNHLEIERKIDEHDHFYIETQNGFIATKIIYHAETNGKTVLLNDIGNHRLRSYVYGYYTTNHIDENTSLRQRFLSIVKKNSNIEITVQSNEEINERNKIITDIYNEIIRSLIYVKLNSINDTCMSESKRIFLFALIIYYEKKINKKTSENIFLNQLYLDLTEDIFLDKYPKKHRERQIFISIYFIPRLSLYINKRLIESVKMDGYKYLIYYFITCYTRILCFDYISKEIKNLIFEQRNILYNNFKEKLISTVRFKNDIKFLENQVSQNDLKYMLLNHQNEKDFSPLIIYLADEETLLNVLEYEKENLSFKVQLFILERIYFFSQMFWIKIPILLEYQRKSKIFESLCSRKLLCDTKHIIFFRNVEDFTTVKNYINNQNDKFWKIFILLHCLDTFSESNFHEFITNLQQEKLTTNEAIMLAVLEFVINVRKNKSINCSFHNKYSEIKLRDDFEFNTYSLFLSSFFDPESYYEFQNYVRMKDINCYRCLDFLYSLIPDNLRTSTKLSNIF